MERNGRLNIRKCGDGFALSFSFSGDGLRGGSLRSCRVEGRPQLADLLGNKLRIRHDRMNEILRELKREPSVHEPVRLSDEKLIELRLISPDGGLS